jgi:predicted  nucleic acid-binding Zn-ribbon protein
MDTAYIQIGFSILIQVIALVWFSGRIISRLEQLERSDSLTDANHDEIKTLISKLTDAVTAIDKSMVDMQGKVLHLRDDYKKHEDRISNLERKPTQRRRSA